MILFSCAEKLNLKVASEYKYLNQSDCMTIDGVDDAKKFQRLRVYCLTVHLLNSNFQYLFGLLRSHVMYFFLLLVYVFSLESIGCHSNVQR